MSLRRKLRLRSHVPWRELPEAIMAGNYMRGALVQFMETFLLPLPNVIIFQYNPETITHTWTQPEAGGGGDTARTNPLAVRGLPGESFSLSISMDANDTIADGSAITAGIAEISGVYSRLAALEMLLFPVETDGGGLLGSVSLSVGAGGASLGGSASADRPVVQMEAPVVLWVWGPGRIVPVRVTSLTITEKLFDGLLNPTHADAQLSLRVLTPEELSAFSGILAPIARAAYIYSQGLRQALAIANLANAAESVVGMLPI
jgi:hypothetical protein